VLADYIGGARVWFSRASKTGGGTAIDEERVAAGRPEWANTYALTANFVVIKSAFAQAPYNPLSASADAT